MMLKSRKNKPGLIPNQVKDKTLAKLGRTAVKK